MCAWRHKHALHSVRRDRRESSTVVPLARRDRPHLPRHAVALFIMAFRDLYPALGAADDDPDRWATRDPRQQTILALHQGEAGLALLLSRCRDGFVKPETVNPFPLMGKGLLCSMCASPGGAAFSTGTRSSTARPASPCPGTSVPSRPGGACDPRACQSFPLMFFRS
jgi:hypothetical protein